MTKRLLFGILIALFLLASCTQPPVETPTSSPVEIQPPMEIPKTTPETTPGPAPATESESPLIPSEPAEPTFAPEAAYEKLPLDLYTQKGGRGQTTEGGTFGPGESVRLLVQLDIVPPATVDEASEFFRTDVVFQVYNPDGSPLISRAEPADLKGRSVIAFMLPSGVKTGTYQALATYNYQGNNLMDCVSFVVDPSESFNKISRSGRINENENWSGTVYITGDLRIEDGVSVTIEPGTTVFFAAHSDDRYGGQGEERTSEPEQRDPTYTLEYAQTHCAMQGSIVARGTEDNMVIFTSDSLNPSYADWHDLSLRKGSLFENVIVEYAQCFAMGSSCGDTERVSQSIIRHILSAGIGINAPSIVSNNLIYDCGHEGIDVSSASGKPVVVDNVVFHSAVGIFTHASPIIEHNLLIDNDRGICIYGGSAIVHDNLIASPRGAPHDWIYEDFAYEAYHPHGNRLKTRGIRIRDASPTITGNVIGGHPENIEVAGNSLPIINNNVVLDSIEVGSWTIISSLEELGILGIEAPSSALQPVGIDITKNRGNQPSDLVITPDGSRVYVSAMGTHNVFVIDTKTNTIVDVIDLWEGGFDGTWPFRLAIAPDGRKIYVANMMSNNISVIDTSSNRVVAAIDIGHAAHDIAFTPDGKFAYIDMGWDRIAVVDVSANEIINTVLLQTNNRSHTLAISHDGSKVYVVSQSGGGCVYVIDVATNKVIDQFDLGKQMTNQGMIALSPDDSKLYIPCGITGTSDKRPDEGVNKLFVVDLASKSVAAETQVIGGPIAVRLSSDGQLAYVSTFAAGKVMVVDIAENVVVGEIEWGEVLAGEEWRKEDLRDMAITPDARWLYITGWDADAILVADLVTCRMTNIIELNEIETRLYEIAITPDGSRVYVSSQAATPEGESGILVIDTSTNSVIDRIVRDSYPSNPYIAPDGQLLYAVSGNKVLVIEVAVNKIVREISLGEPGGFFYDIAVNPRHGKAYVTNVRSRHVHVIDLAMGAVTKKIDVGWWPQMVVVTPDGSRAYVSRQNNPYDSGGLVVIDTTIDEVVGMLSPTIGTGAKGRFDLLVVGPDGTHLYWATGPQWINVIEIATNKLLKSMRLDAEIQREWGNPRGTHPSDIAFTSDGSRAYIPCGDAYYIAVLDIASGTVIDRIMDVGIEPVAIVISPDDRFAYVTNHESESISVIDLTTNKVVDTISVRR